MTRTPLSKAANAVWANQLTRLSRLVVYVKFPFVYTTTGKIGSQRLLASTSSNVLRGRSSEKAFNDYLVVFPSVTNAQLRFRIPNLSV